MMTFEKRMLAVTNRFDLTTVFSDFLEMSVCALSLGAKEERYLEIISRYDKQEVYRLSDAFASLVKEMDNSSNGLKDVLGEFFTIHITRGHNGQYFTPDNITDLMATLSFDSKNMNPVRVLDPACGSGRMLISGAKQERRLKNCNNNRYYGADLDRRCAIMTAINLCLNGLQGEASCMNSISNEFFTGWQIELHPNFHVPFLKEITEKESRIYLHIKQESKATTKIEKQSVSQLELFAF